MSLTTAKNGDVTLSKARHKICMEAAWELDAIAPMIPDAVDRTDEVAMASYLKVRCLAARVQALANALMAGLYDDAVPVTGLGGLHYQVLLSGDEG
jgi:hypothetical protein